MFIYFIISLYLHFNKPDEITILHKLYEISIGTCGLLIAILRIVFINHSIFRLPTIYIAVIYGMAVIFYYSYKQSFLIYFFGAVILVTVLPIYKPSLQESNYIADTISNSFIAWIASMAIYQKFVKEFINNKTIENKNKKLKEKNKQINKINNKLKERSIKDTLTGVYNRGKIEDVLNNVYEKVQKNNKNFSIILLDLDNFKKINDRYGHPIGDKILKKICHLLNNNIRELDTLGRWGGEEFLIVCSKTNLKSAINLAQRLRKLIVKTDFPYVNKVTSSFGVASYSKGENLKSIIKNADDNLYKAKENGRNTVKPDFKA